MANQTATTVPGSSIKVGIHPEIKNYTLRDNGFIVTKNGNYQLERPLSHGMNSVPVLKITITKNFDRLRLSTVMKGTAKRVNVFAGDKYLEDKKLLEFTIQQLIEEKILEKIN